MATEPKTRRQPVGAPWTPVEYDAADCSAIRAVAAGDANPDQQRRAIAWIVNAAAATYGLSFRPGESGDRETAFAEGRRFVGLQIVKMTKLNPAAISAMDQKRRPQE